MIALQKSTINGYFCPSDPGEPVWNDKRLSVNDLEAQIISEFARDRTVLEIGTGLGVSTRKLAETAKLVHTVDIDSWVAKNVAPTLPENVRFFRSINNCGVAYGFDMAFIDGCHEYQHCLADTKEVKKLVRHGGLILFHDASMQSVIGAIVESGLDATFIETIAGLALAWNYDGIGSIVVNKERVVTKKEFDRIKGDKQ